MTTFATMKNKRVLVHAGLVLVALIYGATFVLAKEVMPDYLGPFGFIWVRVFCALLLLAGFHNIFIKESIREKGDYLRLAICGFFGASANMMMFFQGLSYTSPINASLIMTSTPIIVLVVASLLIGERITLQKLIGITLGATGAIYLILNSPGSEKAKIAASTWSWLGDLLVFLNACSYATYLVIVKPLMQKYHPLTVVKWSFTFGLVYISPLGIPQVLEAEWSAMPATVLGSIAFVTIGTTFLAYILNAWALRYVSSAIVGSYIYLQPLFATFIAVLIGNYLLTIWQVLFGLLIFLGVYLVSKPDKKGAIKKEQLEG